MQKLVNKETNTVNYGMFDGPIDFNWDDYQLHSFFDKKISSFKKKFGFHKFHFISFINKEYIVGLAFVDVSLAKSFFGYVYQKNKGLICEWQKDVLGKKMVFTNDVDNNVITYKKGDIEIDIKKAMAKSTIDGHFKYKNIIDITYQVKLGYENKPLRVINPADFEHWVFTAKRAGLITTKLDLSVNGQKINMQANDTLVSIDWSGGYFKRDTSWVWGCGCTRENKKIIGFNFATFNNNALYPENAIWVNNERFHIPHIMFKWDYNNPYKTGMEIWTEDKKNYLFFKPRGQKADINSRMFGVVKSNFRQFFGEYTGHITYKGKKIKLKPFLGLFEIHKAMW